MIGAIYEPGRGVTFRVWAPFAQSIQLVLVNSEPKILDLEPEKYGYYQLHVPDLAPEQDYYYLINQDKTLPDPASRWQPKGVHGPSRILDSTAFNWSDNSWQGVPLKEYIIYELHIGTFTPEGTFIAAIEKLQHLKELGITAVEIMPVFSFPGEQNWGYDGVFPYAPQESYGGPNGLKAFVNACHELGLAVILDVFYNHFGPEGAVFDDFGPYLSDRHHTPWGKGINYDGPDSMPVRDYFIENALYYFQDYHLDALRLDAIQAVYDFGAYHILEELQDSVSKTIKRDVYLIAESDLNDSRTVNTKQRGGYHLAAQWHDDFHHALHTVITGDQVGYFADFGKISDLAKAMKEGFVYDGKYSEFRRRKHGNSSKHLSGDHFTVCIQNHDQVGNGSGGRRMSGFMTLEQQKLAAMLVIFSPYFPFLFMGQEWGSTDEFHFFCDFSDPKIIEATREGRKKEHADHHYVFGFEDPQSLEAYESSKVNWSWKQDKQMVAMYDFYKELIFLRKKHPFLSNCRKDLLEVFFDEEKRWLTVLRQDSSGKAGLIKVNFSEKPQDIPNPSPDCSWMHELGTHDQLDAPWSGHLFITESF